MTQVTLFINSLTKVRQLLRSPVPVRDWHGLPERVAPLDGISPREDCKCRRVADVVVNACCSARSIFDGMSDRCV